MGSKRSAIEAGIVEAERHHDVIASGFMHLPDGAMVVAKDFDAAQYLEGVLTMVERIQASPDQLSSLINSARGHPSIRFNRLGLELFIACRQYASKICRLVEGEWTPLYKGHRLHPVLAVVWPVIAKVERKVQLAAQQDHGRLHRLMDEMAKEIRERCRSEQAKVKAENFASNSRAKLRRALKYLVSLFKKRSRLLILRVDLYVRPGAREWGYSDEADDAFDYFADALARSQIVPDVVGWMIAREDGIERGRHYHVLVAVDGHKHQAGASLAKLIGEFWVSECVGSSIVASYFNCFALLKTYRHLGIGMVRCDDAEKLLGLFYAVRYLCKESVMLIPNAGRPRNFRRGEVDGDYVRRGAPRQMEDDLRLAESVLLRPRPRKKAAVPQERHRAFLYECPR